jgi:hypothetical protein
MNHPEIKLISEAYMSMLRPKSSEVSSQITALLEYHATGTVSGAKFHVKYADYPSNADIAKQNKHLSKDQVNAVGDHIEAHSEDDFTGTKSIQNGHKVHVTANGGYHDD